MLDISEDEILIKILTNEIDWYKISLDIKSIDLIDKYKNHLNWEVLSSRLFMHNYIERFINYINWGIVCSTKRTINIDFIEKFYNYINWDSICCNPNVDDKIFDKYFDKLYKSRDFYKIFNYSIVSKYTVLKYSDFYSPLDWSCISLNVKLTKEEINEYKDKLDWQTMLAKYDFNVEELLKYESFINFEDKYSVLCLECCITYFEMKYLFIPKLKNINNIIKMSKIDHIDLSYFQHVKNVEFWNYMSENYSEFTNEYIKHHYYKLNKNLLLLNKHLDDNIKNYIAEK